MGLTSVGAPPVIGADKNKKCSAQSGEGFMPVRKAARLLVGVTAALAVLGMAVSPDAQEKKIKIGVIFDLTGPLAGGGSRLQYSGVKIMPDHLAKTRGGGYKGQGG